MSALEQATAYMEERKRALGAQDVGGIYVADREREVRALIYGTDLNYEELEVFCETLVSWALHSIANDGPRFGIPAVLDGLLRDVFLHGYHARRLEERAVCTCGAGNGPQPIGEHDAACPKADS